jgi:para-nitrobenzyl esterase
VFVSLNYRVGIDGFMQIPGAPANRGLLDQIAALRWIQQHIASFGGDARRLTVAGGSAGAGAIACLMGMPAASGLFSQAILQSPSVATQSPEEAQLAADAVAQVLQVPLTQDALAQVPLPAAIAALQRLADEPRLREALGLSTRNFFPLRAVVDGEVLSAAPLHALRSSWIRQLPTFSLLVGCNREEMRLYTVPTGAIAQTTEAQLAQFVRDIGLQASAAQADGEQAHHSPGERLCALQSDYYYRVPARRIAADVAQMGLRSYLYEFAWRSPRCDGQLGAAHGLDIPFVFAQTQSRAGAQIAGVPAPEALASLMHSSWARFVKHGAPGWSRHTPEQRHIMRWDTTSACVLDDEDRTRAIWGAAL